MEGNPAYREGYGIHFLPRTHWRIYIVKFWPNTPPPSEFFQFHAVLGKAWQNHILAPPPPFRGVGTPPRGNPGSATVYCGAEIAEYSPKITVIYCQLNIIFKSPAVYKVKAVDDSFQFPLEAAPHDPQKIKAVSARGSTRSLESIFFFGWANSRKHIFHRIYYVYCNLGTVTSHNFCLCFWQCKHTIKLHSHTCDLLYYAIAIVIIQDFPEEGAPTLQGGRQHTILPNFPKKYMKLKEFGPPGGRASKILLCKSATVIGRFRNGLCTHFCYCNSTEFHSTEKIAIA